MNETPDKRQDDDEDRAPLGSWNRVYAVVIGNLLLLILFLIVFTRVFGR